MRNGTLVTEMVFYITIAISSVLASKFAQCRLPLNIKVYHVAYYSEVPHYPLLFCFFRLNFICKTSCLADNKVFNHLKTVITN